MGEEEGSESDEVRHFCWPMIQSSSMNGLMQRAYSLDNFFESQHDYEAQRENGKVFDLSDDIPRASRARLTRERSR